MKHGDDESRDVVAISAARFVREFSSIRLLGKAIRFCGKREREDHTRVSPRAPPACGIDLRRATRIPGVQESHIANSPGYEAEFARNNNRGAG